MSTSISSNGSGFVYQVPPPPSPEFEKGVIRRDLSREALASPAVLEALGEVAYYQRALDAALTRARELEEKRVAEADRAKALGASSMDVLTARARSNVFPGLVRDILDGDQLSLFR